MPPRSESAVQPVAPPIHRRVRFGLVLAAALAAGGAAPTEPTVERVPSLSEAERPPFLPDYYLPAVKVAAYPLKLAKKDDAGGVQTYIYRGKDGTKLDIVWIGCEGTTCETAYANTQASTNQSVTGAKGRFTLATNTEFAADFINVFGQSAIFEYRLPDAVMIWGVTGRPESVIDADLLHQDLAFAVARHRYEQARSTGFLGLGRWALGVAAYARLLLDKGDRPEAISVLRQLVVAAPADYASQVLYAETTTDLAAAQASARAAFDNSEDPKVIERAAKVLNLPPPADIAELEDGEKGLQVILIPLVPCDTVFVEDAARLYEMSFGIPVKIRRLPEKWEFGPADRIANQASIQQYITDKRKQTINFAGWTPDRYTQELKQLSASAGATALDRYYIDDFIKNGKAIPGQYRGDLYVEAFRSMLDKHRSNDPLTAYVGVTRANIYAGSANYFFSVFSSGGARMVGLQSYAMLQASVLGEAFQSRRRLVERMTKQLVPVTFGQWGIPRPVDPTDPHSYVDSVQRVDQKTLTLSEPTRAALAQLGK